MPTGGRIVEPRGMTACLRLAQFLNARLQRLDLVNELPEMAKRYEGLFGKDYLEALRRQDRAKVVKEAEALFERAAAQYGDVNMPYDAKLAQALGHPAAVAVEHPPGERLGAGDKDPRARGHQAPHVGCLPAGSGRRPLRSRT